MTLLGWELIRALAGFTVVVETVFAWPGLGFLAREAIKQQDFFLIQAIVFVVAVMVVIVNIVDRRLVQVPRPAGEAGLMGADRTGAAWEVPR